MIQAQAFFDEMLRQYPKLNTPAVIDAIYTFTHELVRKSTTALNTVPSEDTETRALTFTDKNGTEIAHISFTQYANANIGINFVLGEHTFTIKVSDEGHIDLRSSYPLSGFTTGTDEVATTEYVIRCAEHYDAILENALKEYIADALNDFEDELKQYSDDKDSALRTELKAYTDNKVSALRNEFLTWKNEIIASINDAIGGISTPSVAIEFGKFTALFTSSKRDWSYTPSTNGILMLGWDRDSSGTLHFYVDGVEKTGEHDYFGDHVNKGTGDVPITFPLKSGITYRWTCEEGLSYGYWTSITVKLIR